MKEVYMANSGTGATTADIIAQQTTDVLLRTLVEGDTVVEKAIKDS